MVVLLFALVLAVRWRASVSNVDDYLYARQTDDLLHALAGGPRGVVAAWRTFGTSTPLVPTLALPLAAFDTSPNALVVVQLIPLVVLLVSCRALLRTLGLGPRASWAAAVLVTVAPPVLGYAAMYHFAVAAAACTALAAASYARSERLARRPASLLLGAAMGALAISRVVAPVYVAALAIPIAVDAAAEPTGRQRRLGNAGLALLTAAVVAAPWWLAAGHSAIHYLFSAGYGNSPFAGGGSRIDIARQRATWTALETGWLLAVVVVGMAAWAVVCVWRRVPEWRTLAVLIAAGVLGMVMLASSGNSGTAFSLPLYVVLACAGVGASLHLPRRLGALVVSGWAATVVLSVVALFGVVGSASVAGRPLWQTTTPGIQEARNALGCRRCRPPDTDALSARTIAVIGRRPTLLVRDDAVLNFESLRFTALTRARPVDLRAPGAPNAMSPAALRAVRYVVAGSSLGSYHDVNPLAAFVALRAARFRQVFSERLSALNVLTVWAAPR